MQEKDVKFDAFIAGVGARNSRRSLDAAKKHGEPAEMVQQHEEGVKRAADHLKATLETQRD